MVTRRCGESAIAHHSQFPAERPQRDSDAEFFVNPLAEIDETLAHQAVNASTRCNAVCQLFRIARQSTDCPAHRRRSGARPATLVLALPQFQFGDALPFGLTFHAHSLRFPRGLDRHRLHVSQKLPVKSSLDVGAADRDPSTGRP